MGDDECTTKETGEEMTRQTAEFEFDFWVPDGAAPDDPSRLRSVSAEQYETELAAHVTEWHEGEDPGVAALNRPRWTLVTCVGCGEPVGAISDREEIK